MKKTALATAALCWFFAQAAQAAAIGEIERTAKIGFAVSALNLSIDDPDGSTGTETEVSPVNLFYTDLFLEDYHYWAEFFYQSATFEASTSNIGQEVSRLGFRMSIQKEFNVSPTWKMLGGVGAYVSKEEFTDRFTKAEDGFLLDRYADRSENILGALIEGVVTRNIGERWDLMFRGAYEIPFGDGVEALSVSAGLMYGF